MFSDSKCWALVHVHAYYENVHNYHVILCTIFALWYIPIELEEQEKRLYDEYTRKNEDLEEERMLLEAERNNFLEQMKIQEEGTVNIALSCVHSIHYIGESLTDICNVPSFC